MPVQPGLLAVASVMLGSTAYDGFSGETRWYTFTQSSAIPARVWGTAALVAFCLVVAGSLYAAAVLSARLAGVSPRRVTTAFAPSLLPIAAGYLVAHYWSLWIWEGTNGLAKMSDPLGTGADWLGTAGLMPILRSSPPGSSPACRSSPSSRDTCSASCSRTSGPSRCSPAGRRCSVRCRSSCSWCSTPWAA